VAGHIIDVKDLSFLDFEKSQPLSQFLRNVMELELEVIERLK
jgi:hypothetical protein